MNTKTAKSSSPIHGHHRALLCAFLLVCVKTGSPLKLTPGPHLTKRLDLDQEVKAIVIAFDEAKELIINEKGETSPLDASSLLHNRAIKSLHETIERWTLVEDRLQSGISSNNKKDARIFEEATSIVAASRALLGQLFWRSNEDEVALKELESSCPVLWEYDVARTSLDSDGWLDCYSTLGDIYVRMSRLEQAVELEKELILRMPWLALTFSGKPTNSKLRTLATISHLTRVSREERRMISVYIKNAWKTAESLRAQLNELVSEFVLADTDKRRMNTYIRTQHLVEETLQLFVVDSNASILHYSGKALSEGSKKAIEGGNKEVANSGDANQSLASSADDTSTLEAEALTRKRESTLLNSALRVELHREASFYLTTMGGVIEGGKHFLKAIRMREQEKAQDRFQSKSFPSNRDKISGFNSPSSSSSFFSSAPMGFHSRDQVMQVFEYLLAHQAERQDRADSAKVAAAAARAARRAAAASASETKSSSSARSSRRNMSSNKQREKNTGAESEAEHASNASHSYGFAGIFMALFAGSGFILRSINKQQGSGRGRGDRVNSSIGRNSKYPLEFLPVEEAPKETDNFVWLLVVALIGVSKASKVPTSFQRICARLSMWLSAILNNLLETPRQIVTFVAPVVFIAKSLFARLSEELESQRVRRVAEQDAKLAALTAWTTATPSTRTAQTAPVHKKAVSPAAPKVSVAPPSKKKAISPKKASKERNVFEKVVQKRTTIEIEASKTSLVEKAVVLLSIETDMTELSAKDSSAAEDHSEEVTSNNDLPQWSGDTRPDSPSPLSYGVETADTPCSPSSVAAFEDTEEVLSDLIVFDDFYWRNIDKEAEGEGDWIDTATVPARGKARKARGVERPTRSEVSLSRQRQQLFQQQLDRKAAETAFSSASHTAPLHLRKATAPVQKRVLTAAPCAPTSPMSSAPASTPVTAPVSPRAPMNVVAATAALKSLLSKGSGPPNTLANTAAPSDFPPLPNPFHSLSSVQSKSSSVENSTDAEDHSSISGDSRLGSPRSRSQSYSLDPPHTFEEQMQSHMAPHMQMGPHGHMMQMPYFPVTFLPMPMHMPDMSQMVFDPSMNVSYSHPSLGRLPDQQQGMIQHQRGMMMMPFNPVYMMPQFDPMCRSPPPHMMNMTEEQAHYNIQHTQINYEAQMLQNHRSMPMSDGGHVSNEGEVVDAVRQQIEYYFSSSNLCHDTYLRSKMDSEGFVHLSEICKWNRVRRLGATPNMILESVRLSTTLEVVEPREVKEARKSDADTAALSPRSILATLIRCAENPLSWVQGRSADGIESE